MHQSISFPFAPGSAETCKRGHQGEGAGQSGADKSLMSMCAQVLLAIYFFLAGCVVSQSRMLWVMPAASAVFACILASVAAASSLLSSAYRCTISTTLPSSHASPSLVLFHIF